MDTRNFEVLFTHQKQKKNKTWQDGFLQVSCIGTKAVLFDDQRNLLEVFHIQMNRVFPGSDVECDRYLISIGDEKEIEEKTRDHFANSTRPVSCDEDAGISGANNSLVAFGGKRKRKSYKEHWKPDLPIPQDNLEERFNSQCHRNVEKAVPRTSIVNNCDNNSLFTLKSRKIHDDETSVKSRWNTVSGFNTNTNTCFLRDKNHRTQMSAPPLKRNREELLSLFTSKTQASIVSNLEQEQNLPWKMTSTQEKTCLKGTEPPVCYEAPSNEHNGLHYLSNAVDDYNESFFDTIMPDCEIGACSTSVLQNGFDSNHGNGFDRSEITATDSGSDVQKENLISLDTFPRSIKSSDFFVRRSWEQTWTDNSSDSRSLSIPVGRNNLHDRKNGKKFCEETLKNDIMKEEPFNCENMSHTRYTARREVTVLRSQPFTPPLLSSVGAGSNIPRSQTKDHQAQSIITRNSERPSRSSSGELYFPSSLECCGSVTPTREVTIPVRFQSAMEYKQILRSALREHLNIILFELAQSYHGIFTKVDITSCSDFISGQKENIKGPSCSHGPARLRAVKKDGPNKGRHFYSCPGSGSGQCKFFKWADECHTEFSDGTKKLPLSSSESIRVYFKSKNVHLYHDCVFERRSQVHNLRKSYGKRFVRGGRSRGYEPNHEKKSMYVVLKYRENSSLYSKDDIWIISKTFNFEPCTTFIARSLFYGPSSSGDLEIEPMSGYSPSNWRSGDTVQAIWACNAGTELSCIRNLEDHVTPQQMPLLPYILNGSQPSYNSCRSRCSSFTAPMLSNSNRNSLGVTWQKIEEETGRMAVQYKLNEDQAAALFACARMFLSDGDTEFSPITLIHGVFGAGKSFLLAVVVLLMMKLFEIADESNERSSDSLDWKILISSTTNVAVDRILLGLLDLGFEQFVRVGSMRKIAKPILPFSIHSVGTESHELKELQSMLKSDLTSSEKTYVRKSIERHKLGENRKRLANVRVVGVTCAACVFPSLDKLKFPVLLLDECSQMTEPNSLLPLARFGCRKLVLVGDPKQLNPTIQGSEPEHDAGLEQTLFDRFMKMDIQPILLRTQYRCHPRISSVANRLFYNDSLLDGVTTDQRKPVVDFLPTLCFYNVSNGREECSQDGSYCNQSEARFVVFVIKSLLESEVDPTQIGVITQYKSQLTTITNALMSDGATSHKELKGIQISTVDAFQGGEKDVIILSCVRTQHVGFIDCARRTNVALTRAKRHLCIVGCGKMLSSNSLWGKIITFCRESENGVQSYEQFMREWKERKPTTVDDNTQKGKRSKTKTRKSKSVENRSVPPQDNSPSQKSREVSGHITCLDPSEISFSDFEDPSLDCHEVQQNLPTAETLITDQQMTECSKHENDNLLSELALCFDPLTDDELSNFSCSNP